MRWGGPIHAGVLNQAISDLSATESKLCILRLPGYSTGHRGVVSKAISLHGTMAENIAGDTVAGHTACKF